MKVSEIKIIQNNLAKEHVYSGNIDGKRGLKTSQAIEKALLNRASQLPESWNNWSDKRKAVAYLQILCQEKNIDSGQIDGFYGPQTEAASEQLRKLDATGTLPRGFGDITPVRSNPHHFPIESLENLIEFYGQPGQVPLKKVKCPWTLRLDWNLRHSTNVISIHEKLAGSLTEVLQQIYDHYGNGGIKEYGLDRYGGSYNPRKKRGSVNAWSTHAWGIAIDWFPSANKLRWRSERASLANPDLDPWWEIWEREGWLSLGRSEDRDWMHVQAAKR